LSADAAVLKVNDDMPARPMKPGGLGHGIFWRPSELNWKFLAWEWVDEEKDDGEGIRDTMHV
jgi:tRNA-specific adenosine deaminase 3